MCYNSIMANEFEVTPLAGDNQQVSKSTEEVPAQAYSELEAISRQESSENVKPPSFAVDDIKSLWRRRGFYLALSSALVILLIFGLFVFWNRNNFSDASAVLSINAPQEITAGDRVDYLVTYENVSTVDLTNARLTFHYPTAAVPIEDGNTNQAITKTIDLGEIKAGSHGQETISAFIVGDQGEIKKAKATLTYRPVGIASDFEKISENSINISHVAVPITFSAPPKVLSGQKFTYSIAYKNQTDSDINDLLLRLAMPEDFKATKFSPAHSSGDAVGDLAYNEVAWAIPKLAAGDNLRYIVEGSLEGDLGSRLAKVRLERLATVGDNNVYVDFEKAEVESIISAPLISIEGVANGQADYVAAPGDQLHYRITVTNKSDAAISDIRVSAKMVGALYDLARVESGGLYDSRAATIDWDSSNQPNLSAIGAGQSAEISFNVYVKEATTIPQNSVLTLQLHAETDNVPPDTSADLLSSDGVCVTQMGATPKLNSSLLVNDRTLGASPVFPPRVNETTLFTIHWKLTNPLHGLSPARVSATLPVGVIWTNTILVKNSSANPIFDPATRTVSWDVGPLPEGVGTTQPAAEAFFQVSVTPSLNQAGENLSILENNVFEATDSVTGQSVHFNYNNLTSSDVSDSSEDGRVAN